MSCSMLPCQPRRWRPPTRDDAGAHQELAAAGTPFGMAVPALGTHGLPVQTRRSFYRWLAQMGAPDRQGLGFAGMVEPVAPDPRV